MGDLNNWPTVDEAAGLLWEKSADRVFAVAPVAWLPTDGKAARYSHLIIGSADASGEAHFDQIPLEDGADHGQTRIRLTDAIRARGSCVIHNFDNEDALGKFCELNWPRQRTDQEDEIVLAQEFPDKKKQIESFVLDRTREARASSRIMNFNWHEILKTLSDVFADDMNNLDASERINQAKMLALGLIDYAFSMGVLIGKSMSDEEVTKILEAEKLVRMKPTLDYFEKERPKKLAAIERAIAVADNWDERFPLVNKDLGQETYKNGNSLRVAYTKLKKAVDKKRND
jgi:hypothetical protein